jgi:hypothetical protein
MIPSDSTILERVHDVETIQARHDVKLENLEEWVHDIHKTVKGLEKKASMLLGALIVIEVLLKFWK